MKKTFPLLLVLLFLLACTSTQNDSSASQQTDGISSIQTKAAAAVVKLKDLQGYFVKSAHDGAWLLFLKQEDSTLRGHLIQYAGMLPPHEFLESPDAGEDILQRYEIKHLRLAANGVTFNSEVGKGEINPDKVVFEEIIDLEEKLTLVRASSYPYTP